MRSLAVILLVPLVTSGLSSQAAAAPRHGPARAAGSGAQQIGKFEDWTAVTRDEAGQTICYAFAYPTTSIPTMSGRSRPVLTVTQRPAGRDTVAFSSGFPFPENTEANLQVEQANRNFYTSGRSAFARDGAAVVTDLRNGRQAVMRSPGPRGAQVTDTFGLRGFTQAYDAVVKACPAP